MTTQTTQDVAKDQAASVGQGAADAGQHVAGVAKEQATQVTAEAGAQAKQLVGQAQAQVKEQAGAQQEKLVSGLRALGDELSSMAKNADQPGIASDLARQAGERTSAVAGWLDGREPASVLSEVSSFARRRPGTFLAVAAGIGLVAGRLTRGLAADAKAPDTQVQPSAPTAPAPQPTPYPVSETPLAVEVPSAPAIDTTATAPLDAEATVGIDELLDAQAPTGAYYGGNR